MSDIEHMPNPCTQECVDELKAIKRELRLREQQLAAAQAENKHQRQRIEYLEGATNHAGGTPLTKARIEIEQLKAKLEACEQYNKILKYTETTTLAEVERLKAKLAECETALGKAGWDLDAEGWRNSKCRY